MNLQTSYTDHQLIPHYSRQTEIKDAATPAKPPIVGNQVEEAVEEAFVAFQSRAGFGLPISDYHRQENPFFLRDQENERAWSYEVQLSNNNWVTIIFGESRSFLRKLLNRISKKQRRFVQWVEVRTNHTRAWLRTQIANKLRTLNAVIHGPPQEETPDSMVECAIERAKRRSKKARECPWINRQTFSGSLAAC